MAPRSPVSAADQLEVFTDLLDQLRIDVLHAVVGASIGGLITLNFATRFADRVNVIPIASGLKTTVLTRLNLFEQVIAIENDPHFSGGDYYEAPHRNTVSSSPA